MKELVFDSTLSVQVSELDNDHRKLVELFNLLNRALTDGDTPDYIHALFDELLNCTIWHFSHEERLMLKYKFDGLAEHKQEHLELIQSARELQQRFLLENNSITNEELEYLEHWLTGHIMSTDMKLGNFLSEVL